MASRPFPPVAEPHAEPSPAGGERIEGHVLLAWRREQLARGGNPADFDWLLDLAGGLRWSELQRLRLRPERCVGLSQARSALAALWLRHLQQGVPLQYLVGLCPWRDLEINVAPGVLIPRQETELLIDLACCPEQPPSASGVTLWADLGTGSGCLAVALGLALPASFGLAVDLSPAALRQASANLARHGLRERVAVHQGCWWKPLGPWWGRLQLVVANPPYIPTSTLGGLDPVVREHEPTLALDGGPDGLLAIRSIVADAPRALAPGGRLLIEHHHDQSSAVLAMLIEAGLESVRAHHDLEGVPRFAVARRPLEP